MTLGLHLGGLDLWWFVTMHLQFGNDIGSVHLWASQVLRPGPGTNGWLTYGDSQLPTTMGIPNKNAAQLHKKKRNSHVMSLLCCKIMEKHGGIPNFRSENCENSSHHCKLSLRIRKIIQTSYLIMIFPSEWKLGVISCIPFQAHCPQMVSIWCTIRIQLPCNCNTINLLWSLSLSISLSCNTAMQFAMSWCVMHVFLQLLLWHIVPVHLSLTYPALK